MDSICKKNNCTACQACMNVCPVNAIRMQEDDCGFVYPVINSDTCIDCESCKRVCPALSDNIIIFQPIQTYAGWSKDVENRHISTSGGLAYELSKQVVLQGGVFCGCRWNVDHAEHAIVENINELHQFQGSKYAYSDVGDCYKRLQSFLKTGRSVLFIGTACQVAGLKSFLRKDFDNLYTADILCHGIPSQKALRDRIKEVEKLNDSKQIKEIRFRDKKIDQMHTFMKYVFSDGSFYSHPTIEDPFYLGFDANYLLRENCFDCKFAQAKRVSDITLADYWGYFPSKLSMVDYQDGVSLIVVNTKKGDTLILSIKNLQLENRSYEQARRGNPNLRRPQNKPAGYKDFWNLYKSGCSLSSLSSKYFPTRSMIPIYKKSWKTYLRVVIGNKNHKGIKSMNIKKIIHFCLWPLVLLLRYYRNAPRRAVCKNLLKLQPDKKRVFYLGITEHSNLGDMAQHYCIKKWIGENYPDYELLMFEATLIVNPKFTNTFFNNLQKVFSYENDVIVIQSGYSTQDLGGYHPLMHLLVCDYMKEAKILMMPQTIFFKSEENRKKFALNHNQAKKMLFLARDFVSYDMAKSMFDQIRVEAYPDIVTTLIGTKTYSNERQGVCICTRNDSEKLYSVAEINRLASMFEETGIFVKQKDTQSHANAVEIRNNLQNFIETEIESYSHFKVTITDRYHGTIFSLCAGTPVIIIKTNDHKVTTGADWFRGVYDEYVYVANDLDDAYKLAKEILEKNLTYQLEPYFKVNYYDKLKKLFTSVN